MDKIIKEAEKYVETWLSYQSLWEIDIKNVFNQLGDDINKWSILLNEIKAGRSTFDNNETEIFFGSIQINYSNV